MGRVRARSLGKLVRAIARPRLTTEDRLELEGATLFDPRELDEAIVGVHRGCAVYDYDGIVEVYSRMLRADGEENAWEAAVEWVDFNTLGVLPNIHDRCPVIVRIEEDALDEGRRFVFQGITYRQVA